MSMKKPKKSRQKPTGQRYIITKHSLEAVCCGLTTELAKALNDPKPDGSIDVYSIMLAEVEKHWTPYRGTAR